MIYAFVEAQKANHRVSTMCRVLRVSKSGFYGWRDRPPCARARVDALLSEEIARIHADSRQTYGAPRIHFELRTLGVRCARKRVARLMRQAGLFGCGGRRRKARTTLRSRSERIPPAPDLVKRNFTPEAPDRLWVADITYVRTWEGWLYLSFVLDAYSRRIVGWAMASHLETDLVLDAANMAIYNRRPAPGLIHHSDGGSQYTSVEFGSRLKEAGLLPSMGSVADAYDNSMAESFVSTLKRELIHRHSWPSRQMARTAIFEYIETFYNLRRRHSALGSLSPREYEEVRLRGGAVAYRQTVRGYGANPNGGDAPADGRYVVFCADGEDYGQAGYIFFTHEADVMMIAASEEVESGKLTSAEARELLEPYREVLPPLYTGEQRMVFDPDRFDWDDPDSFPTAENIQQAPQASQIFWYEADGLGIQEVFLGLGGIGPDFSVEDEDALEELKETVSDTYKIVVKKDIEEFDAMGKSVEWARQVIKEAT